MRSGLHVLLSPLHTFDRTVSLSEDHIQHGPVHIIRIKNQTLGYGTEGSTGAPVILLPGSHVIHSPTFKFVKVLDLSINQHDIGAMKLIRVETGEVGIAYRQAELTLLNKGYHLLKAPDRLEGIISLRQQVMELPKFRPETKDLVTIEIEADLYFTVIDADKTFRNTSQPTTLLREMAISTLTSIVRSSFLTEIGASAKPASTSNYTNKSEQEKFEEQLKSSFFERLHDQFVESLNRHAQSNWGIKIDNIRIRDFEFTDKTIVKNLALPALASIESQAKLANIQTHNTIKEAEAQCASNMTIIQAQGHAKMSELDANAQANKVRIEAQAKADSIKLIAEAEAEAEAIKLKARAEQESLVCLGEGKRVFASKLNGDLASQLALLEVQGKLLENTNKVIYMPSDGKFLPGFIKTKLTNWINEEEDPHSETKKEKEKRELTA